MKRSRLRLAGKSTVSEMKRTIQFLAREIVIKRDGGCILRKYRHCNDHVLQADHLITRSNSATYADTRLIVCVCRSCHAWKSLGGNLRKGQYDALVKTILPKERVELWERAEQDSWRPTPMRSNDWLLSIVALNKEIHDLRTTEKV